MSLKDFFLRMRPPLGNKKPVLIAVGLLMLAFILLRCSPANADEAVFDVGLTYTSGFNGGTAFTYTERLADKWDIGLKVVSEQTFGGVTVRNNGGVFAQRIVKTPDRFWRIAPDEIGIGFAYFIGTSRLIGCHGAFELSVRWDITDRVPLTYRHNSNGSICDRNRGQDILSIGLRFGRD